MRILVRTLVFFLCLPALWFFAPVQLHGHTGYMIVSGISMEGRYKGGDLVLLHDQAHYRVGDVAAYRDRARGIVVLHRIVGISGDGTLTFRGDNNDRNDLRPVKVQDLVGAKWARVPHVGAAMLWVRKPVHAILFALVALVLTLLSGGMPRKGRGATPPEPEPVKRRPTRGIPASLPQLLFANGLALALGVLAIALVAPTTRSDVDSKLFRERAAFSLTGRAVPGTVYPNGRVDGSGAIFTRLVHRLHVGVAYDVTSHVPTTLGGTLRLDLTLAGDNGWHPTRVLGSVPIRGPHTTLSVPLDLQKVAATVAEADAETGIASTRHTLVLVAHVALKGHAGSTPIASTLSPRLVYDLEPNRLLLETDTSRKDQFAVTKTGAGLVTVANALHLGPLAVSVPAARRTAAWASVLLLLALVASLVLARPWTDEASRVAWRYAAWLVPIKQLPRTASTVTDVTDFAALVRIADRHNKAILHLAEEGEHTYLVKENGLLYRYTALDTGTARRAVRAAAPRASS